MLFGQFFFDTEKTCRIFLLKVIISSWWKMSTKDMKNFVIELFADAAAEIRKGTLRGDMIHGDAGIGSIGPATHMAVMRGDLIRT